MGHGAALTQMPCPWSFVDEDRASVFVSMAQDANKDFRSYMEDATKVVDPFPAPSPNDETSERWGFYAVYDGHGGREAADYCETRLHEQVLVEMRKSRSNDVHQALVGAFQNVDSQLAMYGAWNHGATATVALVQRCQGRSMNVHVANVGDSRAVLFSSGDTRRLSKDHRPDDPAEERRVIADGGKIVNGRVGGDLAITRSLGDHRLKGRGVSCTPDVFSCSLSRGQILIIASDGLWDVMTDEEACEAMDGYVKQAVARGGSQQDVTAWLRDNVGQEFVDRAKQLGSQDNILVLVVFF